MIGKKTILAMAGAMMFASALADTQTVDGVTWTYTVANGEASVGGGASANTAVPKATSGALTIPPMLGGCPVTSVGAYAFYGCGELTAVVVPAGVRTINAFAFNDCGSLESVSLPEGLEYMGYLNVFCGCSSLRSIAIPSTVTTLGDLTFQACTSLKSVTIPAGVTTLGDGVFSGCTGLEEIRLDGNTNFTVRAGLLCSKDGKTVLQCPGALSAVNIPGDVTHLGDFSFDGCPRLRELELPESLESIGYGTISDCPVATLHIPANVNSIDGYQFCGCDSLTNFTVDASNRWFSALNGLLYDKTATMLVHCPRGLSEVTVAPQTESVRSWAFEYCDRSMTVRVAKGDADRIRGLIEDSGFDTESMTFVELGASRPDGTYEEVVDGVTFNFTVIDGKASLGGGSNKATVVPTSTRGTVKVPATLGGCPVTALGRSAFDACSGVTEVVLPDGLLDVGSMAFRGCASLQQAFLPTSVTTVGTGTFTGCTALREVTLPDGLASIGNYAFSYCKSVTAVTVPATVTSIGYMAFEGCTGIESVRFNGNVPKGLVKSGLLDAATRVFYPRAYESAYAAIVPAEKFAGYSDAKGLMLMKAASAGQTLPVDDAWANETLDIRFGKGKVAEFKEKFGRDFAAALFKATGKVGADGRAMTVLDDFISGTDPTDGDSKLQAKIEIGADGKPKVTWTPDLNEGSTKDERTYRVMGAKNLGDKWTEVPSGNEADYNFFKVEVSMPNN